MNNLSIAAALCLFIAGSAAAAEPARALEINLWSGKQQTLKNYDPRMLAVASCFAQPGLAERTLFRHRDDGLKTPQIIARGIRSPDGLAVHPETGVLYVSQEDASVVSAIVDGVPITVVDASTPVYIGGGSVEVLGSPLATPEGIAFSRAGDLYVVEDRPGGRLIRFTLDSSGKGLGGEEVWVPGDWTHMAWEGVAVGPHDELLLSGSSAEDAMAGEAPVLFEGVLLYRDRDHNWWQLDRRALRSFSQAAFSRDGSKVVTVCEVTGEVSWMDLRGTKMRWGSSVNYAAESPEGVCLLPDGRVLVAEERGKLFVVDPETDRVQPFADAPGTLETVIWDERSQRVLATEDRNGTLLEWELRAPGKPGRYAIDRARFEPARTPRHIPESCPDFVAKVLSFGGLDYGKGATSVAFRVFASRVPMVAVDAVMTPVGPANTAPKDPIVRLQTVVFRPGSADLPGLPESGPLTVVIATTRAGKVFRTGSRTVSAAVADLAVPFVQAAGTMRVTVPVSGPVGVSEAGICNLHLMGLGETPDFHVVLNPIDPKASYVVVDEGPNGIQQYQLGGPRGEDLARNMVISYSKELSARAKWLGRDERFAQDGSDVRVEVALTR